MERPRTAAAIRPEVADLVVAPQASRNDATSALVAVVSIRSQTITVWGPAGPVLRSRVSTGQGGHDTPTGLFSVIQKNRHHESNIYSGAPMPWMHRITWSGIALHAGVVPNYPASHGCIRLPYDVAPKLWGLSRMGMRVVVAPDDTSLQIVEHSALPQPKLLNLAELDEAVRGLRGETVAEPRPQVVLASVAPSASADRLLTPQDVAQRLKKEAAAAVEVRKRAAQDALSQAAVASAEANAAAAAVRAAEADLAALEAEVSALEVALGARSKDEQTPDQISALTAARARIPDSKRRLAEAIALDAAKNPVAFATARAAREAEFAADEAPRHAREAVRRLEPVSILVSAKEGMVFIRQGFEDVLDAKVEIDDPLEPLGTHVFTAMATDAGGTQLKWSSVTMPTSQRARGDAISALERISLSDRVREEIARRVWTGASLIITDEGISHETGKGTDFVILTK